MFRKILIMAFILIPLKSYADAYEEGKITQLQVEGANLILVWLDGPNDSTDCSASSYWTVHSSDTNYKEKLAMLMSAQATQKQVKLRHLAGWGGGNWDSNKIYSVRINFN
jgi:hypothetical protein